MSDLTLSEVRGFEDLKRKIKELGDPKRAKREVVNLLKRSASDVISVSKALVPVSKKPHLVSGKRTRKMIQPGALRKSIGTIEGRRGRAVDDAVVYVGPRARGNYDGWYGHMVHDGHAVYRNLQNSAKRGRANKNVLARNRSKSGGNSQVSFVKGQPFMRKAYEQTQGRVSAAAADRIASYMDRRIKALSDGNY